MDVTPEIVDALDVLRRNVVELKPMSTGLVAALKTLDQSGVFDVIDSYVGSTSNRA